MIFKDMPIQPSDEETEVRAFKEWLEHNSLFYFCLRDGELVFVLRTWKVLVYKEGRLKKIFTMKRH